MHLIQNKLFTINKDHVRPSGEGTHIPHHGGMGTFPGSPPSPPEAGLGVNGVGGSIFGL